MSIRLSAALLIAAASVPAVAADVPIVRTPALDKLIGDRVAGAPVDCIDLPRVRSSDTLSNPDTIVYRTGQLLYVNQPAGGCGFRSDPIIVSRTPSTRLCRGDIISSVDRGSRMPMGSCGLGTFTPYAKAK
ncbi:hypothetical protein [Sphingomonas prati]|uniref:Uncharacterized protein n=1 Tax=Sphingomonas prati TaxID=1843237 RepID=A0A7W9F2K7_9SPHN|nr:hypothetical protein [Sphingomonas prati]MBB5728884.1 hypothetical protein [Sphingomonas prati]GGE86828.1 hypothetical protein GCM10011404_19470 [Sphingomonas prati]